MCLCVGTYYEAADSDVFLPVLPIQSFFPRPAPVCIANLGSHSTWESLFGLSHKTWSESEAAGLVGVTPLLLALSILSLCHGMGAQYLPKWERRQGRIFLHCPEPLRVISLVQNALSRKQQHSLSHGIIEMLGLRGTLEILLSTPDPAVSAWRCHSEAPTVQAGMGFDAVVLFFCPAEPSGVSR